jgi:phosphatidate cytidylyltransferase
MEKFKTLLTPELKKRAITAAIAIPLTLAFVITGGVLFNIIMLVAVILISFEWKEMTLQGSDDIAFNWNIFGIFYITIPVMSLMLIRNFANGADILIWLLFTVWATDIMAYLTGKTFGGAKLAEKISPNKTWSGFVGGIGGAAIVAMLTFFVTKEIGFFSFILLTILLSVASQCGDLLESFIKRKFKIKDTGNLFPGHGGILDRVDGLMIAAPIALLIALLHYNKIF